MNTVKKVQFIPIGDERGSLVSLEEGQNIPFNIQRVYYIFNTQSNVTRGRHAHKNLQQILICTSGSCTISCDDGIQRQEYTLSKNTEGLYIENLIWREMFNFSTDCVLMVLASDAYKEEDYVRNYDEFLELMNEN